MSKLIHLIVVTVWTPPFFISRAATALLGVLLFRPFGGWWKRQREGKEGVLEIQEHMRFHKNGGRPVRRRWWDHGRAWWGHFTWRWSEMGKEARESDRNLSLPPPGLFGRGF
jgi:hypothetical protein